MCQGGSIFSIVYRCGVHIERAAVAFTEEYHLSVACEDRVTVFTWIGGDLGMGACGCIVVEDVAGYRRGMVLAPDVLAAGTVVVEERLSVSVEADGADGGGRYLLRAAASGFDFVELGDPGCIPHDAGGGVLDGSGEVDILVVGRECQRCLCP